MAFWKYNAEAKRLKQEDGLGDWKDRPLEYREDVNARQQSASPVCNFKTFSQRKAKDSTVQEVQDLTPTHGSNSTEVSHSEQQDTSSNRPRDNVCTSTRQDSTSSSSKPSKQPFSSKHKRQG